MGAGPQLAAVKLLHGGRAPDSVSTLDPPEWLSDGAKLHWHRLAPRLVDLSEQDSDVLSVLCVALARYQQVTELIDQSSILVRGANGLVRNPLLSVQAEAERTVLACSQKLGLLKERG